MAKDTPKGVSEALHAIIKKAYGVRGHQSTLKARQAADLSSRLGSATILQPEDLNGEYDVSRMLNTTIGDKGKRPLTQKDLLAFKQNIVTAKTKYIGGITPQKVINLSDDEDIKRAQAQIKTAVLSRRDKKGRCYIVTNASGEDPKVHQHIVTVDFLQFGEALVTAGNTPDLVKHFMSNGKIAYDCDCGRHTYWYRYITTIGGFNAGRPETGFPKIRNPNLIGVACKHVITVMHRIQQPTMRGQFASWLKQARATQDNSIVQATAAEMKAEALRQAAKAHHKPNQAQRKENQMILNALQKTKIVPKGYKEAIESLDLLTNKGTKFTILSRAEYQKALKNARLEYGVE